MERVQNVIVKIQKKDLSEEQKLQHRQQSMEKLKKTLKELSDSYCNKFNRE